MNIEKAIQLLDSQQYDASLELLNVLIMEEDQKLRAYYWRASVFLRKNEHEKALADINSAIDLYDEYADAYSQRGVIYFHLGALHLALKDMDKAVELEPKNPYRYSSRAYINGHLKNMEAAVADYKMAIELDPEDAVAHNNLGMLEEQMGYHQQAAKRFKKADGLAVNQKGELVKQVDEPKTTPAEDGPKMAAPVQPSPKKQFFALLKSTLTTRKGFLAYWKFLTKK